MLQQSCKIIVHFEYKDDNQYKNPRYSYIYILVDSLLWNTLLSLQKYNKIMEPSLHIVRHNDSLITHNASKILLECTVDV